jgi:cytochrome b561
MSSPVRNYNLISRTLHWISALTVFSLFGIGLWMVDLSYYSEWYKTAPQWHKSIGLILAAATIFRLVWKALSAEPRVEGSRFEMKAATMAHHTLYLLLFGLFVSGYLISTSDGRGIEVFGWFTVPAMGELFANQSDVAGEIHYYCGWAVIALSALHALAALKHHFINKDNTLKKMLGAVK